MNKKTIVVIGATGMQGKGVVKFLDENGSFNVRAITRNPDNYSGKANEVVKADLNEVNTLKEAFKNAYGVFVVTNFTEHQDELSQVKNVIEAAKINGIQHFIWSTLPNVEVISKGKFNVPFFTGKAKANKLVTNAGFKYHTFVQPPFYFQNFSGILAPMLKQDGTIGWTFPINPKQKSIHLGDINDLGKVVTGAFSNPEKVGNGSMLSFVTQISSFNEIIETYKGNGKDYSFTQVNREVFSTFFEGANLYAEMFGYIEEYSFMGPNSEASIALAKEIAVESFTTLDEWIKQNN
ncbi:NmrA/HSCARG family protein [Flavobacterium sp. J27]|uniref:NmrA/HSCARG family protein n=1 Tax=Flavobacterium sp. J27 TaxID=2060419 RepID=UPI00103079CB|nr:NmrA/HSCARG family protein [Flavobacterium sp. J27]